MSFFRITDYQIGLHCLYSGKGGLGLQNYEVRGEQGLLLREFTKSLGG